MFEEVRNAALSILKTEGITTDDLETYRRMMESAYKFKQLDQPDPEQNDSPALHREIKVYDLTGKRLGLPNIDRNEVAALIDRLDINETERERIRVDAGVKPIDIDKVIDNTIAIANDQTDEN